MRRGGKGVECEEERGVECEGRGVECEGRGVECEEGRRWGSWYLTLSHW